MAKYVHNEPITSYSLYINCCVVVHLSFCWRHI